MQKANKATAVIIPGMLNQPLLASTKLGRAPETQIATERRARRPRPRRSSVAGGAAGAGDVGAGPRSISELDILMRRIKGPYGFGETASSEE